jgi:eukaryotic-like serine/threonine-protein kinase
MTLSAGVRLGVYEILAPLGKGGMGEVWRARDTRLDRDVAIKTLPPEVASDPDRLARFEREAKLLASLHHANIGAIHGLEDSAPVGNGHSGPIALVLELVEGDTLADRIAHGPIPVAEALKLGVQICAALEAAHDAGVIHRDLKPANIKVTADGVVKVLDFGLAKAFTGAHDVPDLSLSPTISLAATQAGIILGTAAYMAPEQASGRASDTRADIWSFGVVLFEMLTGRPVFGGETVSHVLAAVLATDPPWATLPSSLHPRLREVLERCLAKKASDRYRHIGDVRADLERVLADPQGPIVKPVAVTVSATGARAALPWIVVAAAVGLAMASALAWWMWPAPAARPIMRSAFFLPDGQTFTRPEVSMIAVSNDGARLAYVANSQIYVRNLNELDARPVPGTEDRGSLGPGSPVFSPDGQWLAYLRFVTPMRAELKRVPVIGGTPVTLLDSDPPVGLSWPEPDMLLFTTAQGVVRLPAGGGMPQVLIARGKEEAFDGPQVLPDGRQVLFTRTNRPPGAGAYRGDTQIVVQSIGSNDRRVIQTGGAAARYVPTGHLVYAQGGTVFAAPFDAATATMRGGPVPIVEGVRRTTSAFSGAANYALSNTGTLAFIPGTAEAAANRTTLVWIDRNGREEALPIRPGDYTMARVSPDGATIALIVGYGLQRAARPPALWLFDLRRGNLSLLTGDPAGDDGLVWSSDSRRIFFRSFRGERPGVYAIDIASGTTQLLASSPDFPFPLPWAIAPGNNTLAVINATSLTDTNIATLSLTGGGGFTHLLHDPAISENEPSISPNGAWMAYQQGSTPAPGAAAEINIRPFPGVMRTRIPLGPGRGPVFSRDGSELFFFDGEGISTAPISYTPGFGIGQPRQLFKIPSIYEGAGRAWDVDPSGKRFLVIRPFQSGGDRSQAPRPRIDIVLNWAEELKARVPVK